MVSSVMVNFGTFLKTIVFINDINNTLSALNNFNEINLQDSCHYLRFFVLTANWSKPYLYLNVLPLFISILYFPISVKSRPLKLDR